MLLSFALVGLLMSAWEVDSTCVGGTPRCGLPCSTCDDLVAIQEETYGDYDWGSFACCSEGQTIDDCIANECESTLPTCPTATTCDFSNYCECASNSAVTSDCTNINSRPWYWGVTGECYDRVEAQIACGGAPVEGTKTATGKASLPSVSGQFSASDIDNAQASLISHLNTLRGYHDDPTFVESNNVGDTTCTVTIQTVTHDSDMQARAQQWANHLADTGNGLTNPATGYAFHSNSHPYTSIDMTEDGSQRIRDHGEGENLYMTSDSSLSAEEAGIASLNSWYEEYKCYNYVNPGDPAACDTSLATNGDAGGLDAVGHFTAMVWAPVTKAGFGMAKDANGRVYVAGFFGGLSGPANDASVNSRNQYTKNVGLCKSTNLDKCGNNSI